MNDVVAQLPQKPTKGITITLALIIKKYIRKGFTSEKKTYYPLSIRF